MRTYIPVHHERPAFNETFYSLREIDIELMRRLSPRVNVIPVIGKADSLTPSELRGFKKRVSYRRLPSNSMNLLTLTPAYQIMEDIEYYDIPVYNFPYDIEEDDEDTIQDNSELRVRHEASLLSVQFELTFVTGHDAVLDHWL